MNSTEPSLEDATEVTGLPNAGASAASLAPGARLGVYVIRSILGEGGMGRVYLAEQMRPVRREVALKLIREQVESPLARAYFDVESQALAQMQHPAIAQVFEAGTTAEGHPYIAMEVVEGVPLTRFCREEKLGRDARLALFTRVCHGVQHAHQKGVIHRDLKPENVLVRRVDGAPAPKIIDFGIAVGGDGQVSAESVERAGTAIYMSPEQLSPRARDLDTRSDVYSLGVMLYEVLTGREASAVTSAAHRSARALRETLLGAGDDDAAFYASAPDELIAAIGRVPAELRAVLRRALEPDRERRYDSAAALADDLERFRDRRPVRAMPQTRLYVARTFLRRHRLGIAAATFVVCALIAGIAVAMAGMREAQRSAAIARTEEAKAEQIADFARSMLAGIDPDRARGMDRSLLRLMLDSAAKRAGTELAAQPAVRASVEHTIADSYYAIGEYAAALQHFDSVIALADRAKLDAVERAKAMVRRAEILANTGNMDEAVKAGQAAFAVIESRPAEDRARLYVENHLAGIECQAGHYDSCLARYQRIVAIERKAFGDEDADTLDAIDGLARGYSDAHRLDEARPLYEGLIKSYTAKNGADYSKTLAAINDLAIVYLEKRDFAAAEKLLRPLLDTEERVFGPEHPSTYTAINNLGGAIRQQGRNEEARPYYERGVRLAHKLYGEDSYRTVFAESNLAQLLRDAGQPGEAETHARFAVDHAEAALGANNPNRATMHDVLATVLTRQHRYAEAEKELDVAWRIFSSAKEFGPGSPRGQDVVDHYIDLYTAWDKPAREAEWRARKSPLAER